MSKPEQYQKDDARQGQSPRGEEDDPRWAPPQEKPRAPRGESQGQSPRGEEDDPRWAPPQEKPRAPRGENQGRSPRGEHPTQGPRQGEAED